MVDKLYELWQTHTQIGIRLNQPMLQPNNEDDLDEENYEYLNPNNRDSRELDEIVKRIKHTSTWHKKILTPTHAILC